MFHSVNRFSKYIFFKAVSIIFFYGNRCILHLYRSGNRNYLHYLQDDLLLNSFKLLTKYSDRSIFVSNYFSDYYFSLQRICCNWNNYIRFLKHRYQIIYFLTFYNIVHIDTYYINHKYYIPFISIYFLFRYNLYHGYQMYLFNYFLITWDYMAVEFYYVF